MRHNLKERRKGGLTVDVVNNNIESALKRLKKRMKDEGWKKDVTKNQYHETKSQKKRKEIAAGKMRHKKRIAKEQF